MIRSRSFVTNLAAIAALFPLALLTAACGGESGSGATGGSAATGSTGGNGSTGGTASNGSTGVAGTGGAGGSGATTGSSGSGGDPGQAKGPAPVLLGAAGDYVILAKSAIANVPTSAITGNLGLSPSAASFITGFSMTKAGAKWTSSQVTGAVFAADNDAPTPINLTTAVSDMQTAYTDAASRPTPDGLDLGAGTIGGLTIVPGLYKWTSSVTIPADLTLSGDSNDVWIFQIAGNLTMGAAKQVILIGGARAKNIFWQVEGNVDLGTTSHSEGVILGKTAIKLGTGASINGRLLAQTAVSIASSAVTMPAP
jgi:hypothetical protein